MASVRNRSWTYNGETRQAWVVTYTDTAGKRRLITPKPNTKAEAQKIAKQIEKNPYRGNGFRPWTVQDLCENYLRICEQRMRDGEISRATVMGCANYVDNHIVPLIGKVKANSLTPLGVSEWIAGMRSGKSPRTALTITRAVGTLRLVLAEAARLELVKRNVIADVPPRKPKVVEGKVATLSKSDIKLLLKECAGPFGLIVKLALYTGMRSGEIRALVWANIDVEQGKIKILQSADRFGEMKSPKTKAGNREVPVPPKLMAELLRYKISHRFRPQSDFVFEGKIAGRTSKIKPVSHGHIHTKWRQLQRKVFGKDQGGRFHFHALRHAAASLFIEQGLTPQQVKFVMGHTSVRMTFDRYGYLFPEDQAAHTASRAIESSLSGEA